MLNQTSPRPQSPTTRTDDVEAISSASQELANEIVLQVLDARYDGTPPTAPHLFKLSDVIANKMQSLPPHERETARIFDFTMHSDFVIAGSRDTKGAKTTQSARYDLITHLNATYGAQFQEGQLFGWSTDPLLVNDLGSISSQWSQNLSSSASRLYRLVNSTSLQQHPSEFDVRPRHSYLTCVQDAEDRLIVILGHDVLSSQNFCMRKTRRDYISFHNPRIIPRILNTHPEQSLTSFSDGSLDTFAKLLVLEFLLASIYLQRVDYYRPLMCPKSSEDADKQVLRHPVTNHPHLQIPLGDFKPRKSFDSSKALKEIQDAEGILSSINNLVDSIEWVLEALKPRDLADSNSEIYRKRMQDLKGLYSERQNNANRTLDALNRQLDNLTKINAIEESKAIKRLTILASIYLPLSLSASVLGMQSPFKAIAHNLTSSPQDLTGTNLLFDFFGTFIVLSTATILTLYGIKLGLSIKSSRLVGLLVLYYGNGWRYGGKGGMIFEFVRASAAWWIGIGFCITVTAIFLVAMVGTPQNAYDIAKWLPATYITVSVLLLAFYFGIYRSLYLRTVAAKRPFDQETTLIDIICTFFKSARVPPKPNVQRR